MNEESVLPESLKTIWESRKLRLEVTLLALATAYAGAFALGGLLIFLYFFRHDFNAGGIAASDTVAMALCSFGFFALTSFLLLATSFAAHPIVRVIYWLLNRYKVYRQRRHVRPGVAIDTVAMSREIGMPIRFEWKAKDRVAIGFGSLLLLFLLISMYLGPPVLFRLFFPLLGAGGFLSLFWFGRTRHVYCLWPATETLNGFDGWMRSLSNGWRNTVVCCVVVLSILPFGFSELQDLSFMTIGFRIQNVNVRLDKADFQQIMDKATRAGIAINPCETIEADTSVLNHVDVLWHRLGTQGLLSFPTLPVGEVRPQYQAVIRMQPLNTDINVLEALGPALLCEEFLSDMLFKADGFTLRESAGPRLERSLGWLNKDAQGVRLRIAVHGVHPTAIVEKREESLGYKQGRAVSSYLSRAYNLPLESILVENFETRTPKRNCDAQAGQSNKLCERMNRRIEISRYSPDDVIAGN